MSDQLTPKAEKILDILDQPMDDEHMSEMHFQITDEKIHIANLRNKSELDRARTDFHANIAGGVDARVALAGEKAKPEEFSEAASQIFNLTPVRAMRNERGDGISNVFDNESAESWYSSELSEDSRYFRNGVASILDPIADRVREEIAIAKSRGTELNQKDALKNLGFDRPSREFFRFLVGKMKSGNAPV